MDTNDKIILRSALKSLRELGTRGALKKNLRNLVETETDTLMTSADFDALVKLLVDRKYASSWFDPVTKEERLAVTGRGIDIEQTL